MLNDDNTYTKLKNNPTNTIMKENNKLIKSWRDQNIISVVDGKKLIINNAQSPKLYGMPKLHKTGYPIRPIVSCNQSPTYNLSKYLANILSSVTGNNDHHIRDSWDLKAKINTLSIPSNYKLISLDVCSLYTSIPMELTKRAIEKNWDQITTQTTLTKKEFMRGIQFALDSTYFSFQDEFYRQSEGLAMGEPLSSVTAQLVMEMVEEEIIQIVNNDVKFFYRYVDDCLAAIEETKVKYLLDIFNKYHDNLKFTIEMEKGDEINFLDLTIKRKNNALSTKWFAKSTSSGRMLNYCSAHPIAQKKGVILALADRAIKLSSEEHRNSAIQDAKLILSKNGYPTTLVNKIFHQKLSENLHETRHQKERKTYLKLPYLKGISEPLAKILKPSNINIAYKCPNVLNNVFGHQKDRTAKKKRTHVVYEIPCQSNCEKVYIGNTKQYLDSRINGHKYSCNVTALKKHTEETKHTFNFDETRILATERNDRKRNMLETMLIIRNKERTVNDRSDMNNIDTIYNSLITTS